MFGHQSGELTGRLSSPPTRSCRATALVQEAITFQAARKIGASLQPVSGHHSKPISIEAGEPVPLYASSRLASSR